MQPHQHAGQLAPVGDVVVQHARALPEPLLKQAIAHCLQVGLVGAVDEGVHLAQVAWGQRRQAQAR